MGRGGPRRNSGPKPKVSEPISPLEAIMRRAALGEVSDAAPPFWLAESLHGHFHAIANTAKILGYDVGVYSDVIALLAMRISELEELNRLVEGVELPTDSRRPAVYRQREDVLNSIFRLLVELGLTPASGGRIALTKKKTEVFDGAASFETL